MKAVAKGYKGYFDLGFEIEELTPEAFEKGLENSKWHIDPENEYRIVDNDLTYCNIADIYFEKEMHYGEYKKNYSSCATKKNSYNSATKTIVVYLQ